MKYFFFILLISLFSSSIRAQSPASIPYQAVVRNVDGSVLSNTSLVITFKIHNATSIGNVVFEETHNTTSNAQGLIILNVGAGNAVTGTFRSINWGSDAKFLHVLMNTGDGIVDLGTQQMMSVPYALYAEDVNVRVSATGDTLFVGNQFSIVPGLSAANPQSMSGLGAVVLPDNTTCQTLYISVNGCNGQDSLLYNDTYYDLVDINGQCWFAENLATSLYNDGTAIPNVTGFAAWGALSTPAYFWYTNNIYFR